MAKLIVIEFCPSAFQTKRKHGTEKHTLIRSRIQPLDRDTVSQRHSRAVSRRIELHSLDARYSLTLRA